MRNIFLICLFFLISCYGVFAPFAIAGNERSDHTSAREILEFSLLRLKESIQKTIQKNERITFENDMLQKGIQKLQKERETLSMKKAELRGQADIYHPQKGSQFIKIVDIDARRKKTRELIAIFQRDIRYLEEKIKDLDNRLSEEETDSYKKTLSGTEENSRKTLTEAEKKLKSLKKTNIASVRKIEELKKTQDRLVCETEGFQHKLNRF